MISSDLDLTKYCVREAVENEGGSTHRQHEKSRNKFQESGELDSIVRKSPIPRNPAMSKEASIGLLLVSDSQEPKRSQHVS
jgi:hypothetical protein